MESYRKGVVSSSFFNLLAQLLSFVTSIAFAYYFGAQAKTDVYYYCLSILSLMAGFIISLDSSVLIPEAMSIAEKSGREESVRFLNFFLYLFLIISVGLTLVMAFLPMSFFMTLSRFDPALLRAHASIVAWSIPLFGLQIISQYLVDILNSYKYFSLPLVLGIINRAVILICLVGFHRSLDVLSILIGSVVAFLLQIIMTVRIMKTKLHWDFKAHWLIIEKRVRTNIFFSQIGNLASTLSAYVPIFLLSAFSAGIITALNYGQRITSIPTLIITIQVSTVIGIKLNEMCAKQDWLGVDQAFVRAARMLLFILLPLSAFLFVYANELMEMLLQRGAFDPDSVGKTALFFRWFILVIPFVAINTLFARLFMATRKIVLGAWFQIIANSLLIILTIIGLKALGAVGYPIALVGFYVLEIGGLFWIFQFFFPFVHYGVVLQDLLKMLIFNSVLALVVWYWRIAMQPFGTVISLATGAAVFAGLFVGANLLFPLNREINRDCLDFLKQRGFYRS